MTDESDVLDLQHDQHQRPGPTWGRKYTTQCYELLKTCGTGEMDDFAVLAQGVVRCLGGMLEVLVSAILSEGGNKTRMRIRRIFHIMKQVPLPFSTRYHFLAIPLTSTTLDHRPLKPIRSPLIPCAFIPIDHNLHIRNQRHHSSHSAASCRGF